MSTVSGISSASTAWSNVDRASTSANRSTERRDRMFAEADSNGDGSVDSAELQSTLDRMAQRSGTTAANADDVLKTMDTDGNGSLSADELDAGMKSLQPAPASTLDFAQRRGGDEIHRGDGPPPDLQATDGTTQDASATGSADGLQSLLTNLFQAADTDGNGSLNTSELDTLKTNLDTAIQSLVGGGDATATASTASTSAVTASTATAATTTGSAASTGAVDADSSSSADRDGVATLSALAELVLKEYAATAASSTAAQTTSAVSLSA